MLLFNLFLRLHHCTPSNTSSTDTDLEYLSHQMLTQSELNFAYKKITAAYREAPLLRNAYDIFLTHCRDALEKQSRTAMLPLIMNYLANIEVSAENAAAHHELILTLFNIHLHEQANALSITPLGRCFVNNPKTLAAFLHWLMQHDLNPTQILQTHLLQDYLGYHLYSLNTLNNPIEQLYTLLNQHPDTQALAQQAAQTRCPEGGLASYALDGTIHTSNIERLDNPQLKIPSIEITPTESNLKALYHIFGVPFLVGLLQWHGDTKHHNTGAPSLIALFNNAHITHQNFTLLLQYLREREPLKKTLATLLLCTTIDELIGARITGIPSLMFYSDYLTTKISSEYFKIYLNNIKQTNTSYLDLIADLSVFLKIFTQQNKYHKSHALLAFNHLFEVTLEHPEVLDDHHLLHQMRKFKPGKKQLITHSSWLENQFNAMVHTHTQTSVESFDYLSIEDLWREMNPKFSAIQTIENISNTFPSDKYKLQCYVLKALLSHLGESFILDEFTQKIGIESKFDTQEITPYERLLIEILVSVDHEGLRVDLINRLDTHASKERPWYNLNFDERSLYMHAAHHGNLGFIMWLKSCNIKHPESYETLAREAVDFKHWPLVQYFHQTFKYNHSVVDDLLKLAVEQNASEAILPLWQEKKCTPRLFMVEKCFHVAIKEGRIHCAQALLACPTPPSDTSITKGYKTAIRTHQTAMINSILKITETRHLPCLNKAIAQEANRRKPPTLVRVRSHDHSNHSCYARKNQKALEQHGLFKKEPDMSRSCNNLTLQPLLSQQTPL